MAAEALAAAALEIAEARAAQKRRLRDALLRGDDAEALRLARVVVGLEDDEEAAPGAHVQ